MPGYLFKIDRRLTVKRGAEREAPEHRKLSKVF
jgi:hypothetical protein